MAFVHVVVGVVYDSIGRVLIARRGDHQHQGGLWEFPGGKVEPGESPLMALTRELKEEIGINVLAAKALTKIEFHYPDKSILLDVHSVRSFTGQAYGREGQPISWVAPERLRDYSFPAANALILNAVSLPSYMAITGESGTQDVFLSRVAEAAAKGARLIQIRLKSIPPAGWRTYLDGACSLLPDHMFTVNSSIGSDYWARLPGLHLTSAHLQALRTRPVRPEILLGASCHDLKDVEQARRIGADYVTISPVLATTSHPSAKTLGWDGFAALAALAHCPAYALGGLTAADIELSRLNNGHGIAAIGAFWG